MRTTGLPSHSALSGGPWRIAGMGVIMDSSCAEAVEAQSTHSATQNPRSRGANGRCEHTDTQTYYTRMLEISVFLTFNWAKWRLRGLPLLGIVGPMCQKNQETDPKATPSTRYCQSMQMPWIGTRAR